MEKNQSNDSSKLAGRTYDVSDYQKKDQLSSGLAYTHEQVSDAYMEGEINPVIKEVAGKDISVDKKRIQ